MARRCPKCRAEFRDEIQTCSDCGVPLAPEDAAVRLALDTQPRSSIVDVIRMRYVDIYKVADALVQYGKALKVVAGIGCLLLVGFGLYQLSQGGSGFEIGVAGLVCGVGWGIGWLVLGTLLSAIGQLARCIVDTCVNSTSLIDAEEKAAVMGLTF